MECPTGTLPAPVISPDFPNAIRNVPFSRRIYADASNSILPLTWRLISGTLPPGLTFSNGLISGTPTTMGSFTFTVMAQGSGLNAPAAAQQFTMSITPSITWNGNGGVGPQPWARIPGTPLGTLPIPMRDGFAFVGWFTAQTGGTQITPATLAPSANTTYWARWTAPTLSINQSTWNPAPTADNMIVNVTSNTQWSVSSSNTSWLTILDITPANRMGNGSFRIRVSPNTSINSRTGRVTITGSGITHTITVTQVAPNLTVSSSLWLPTPIASDITIPVTSNITWNAPTSDVNWLEISNITPANRMGNGSFRISATANTGTSSRTGRVTITGGGVTRTIAVTQAAPLLTISPSTWNPAPAASNVTVNVTSNIQWSVSSSNTSWLTISDIAPANRTGSGSFRLNTTFNTGMSSRTGTVTITGGGLTRTMTITQPPAPPGIPIMVPPREITTSSLTLQWIGVPNVNRYWVYQQNAAGIFVSLGSTTENHFRVGNLAAGATYTFRVFAECDSRGRSNHSEGRFTTWVPLAAPVMQPSENVTTSSLTLRWNNVLSASRYVVYQQNAAGTFVFLGTTVLSTTHFTVNNLAPNTYHTFRIFAECSRRERSPHAEIRVRTQPATLTVSPTAWSPGSGGGNTTISVTSNITWNAPTSNVNWLTATNVSPTNRTGNGSFRINAVANPSTSSRTGTITVTGGGLTRTISVTQAGAPANVTITWNANDGSAVAPWSRAPGTALGTLPRSYPRTDDRALIGWFTTTAQTGGTRVLPTTVVPSTSTTYHARWSNPNRHFEFWWPRGRNISFGFNATDATWLPLMRQGMTNWNYAGNRPPHMPRFNEAPSSANRVIARAFPQYHFLGRVDFALETPPGSGRVYARGPTEQQFNIRMNQHRIALEFPNQATQREVITSVFVHELGHVLGLEHPSGAHANVNSVMQPGGSPNRRTPTAFDIDSVRMLFE